MRKIPVIAAIRHILQSGFNNIAFFFAISWPWIVLWIVLKFLMAMLFPESVSQQDLGLRLAAGDWQVWVETLAPLLIQGIMLSSIAVNWHRYILIDEVPSHSKLLRMDRFVWRYFGTTAVLFLISAALGFFLTVFSGFIAGFFSGLLTLGEKGMIALMGLIIAAGYVGIYIYIVRLSIKLPAVALGTSKASFMGRSVFGFGDALRVSEGNSWRILWIGLGVGVLPAMVFKTAAWLLAQAPYLQNSAWFIFIAAESVFYFLLVMLGITTLTTLYGYFAEGRDL